MSTPKDSKGPDDSLRQADQDDLIAVARRQHEAAEQHGHGAAASTESVTLDSPGPTFTGPPPDSFAGFQILREIHRGGQGVVYQAMQKSTHRKVAIKVMKEGPFASSADKARFEREVQVLGQLKHPNIVTIHDTGVAAGCHYFVMDYISGQPLDVHMASGPRSIDDTLKLFAKICEAVNAAHLRGVIHRDLKPGNIRVDNDGEPHVLDFGLAKVATDAAEAAAMTMTGQFVGSLPWASPEQAEGQPGKIDIRTDVYSLGVILYQMLTGKFPYEVMGNMRDVLDRILRVEPARPSTVRRQVNDEVETIVLMCLSKERERRYQTAGELARDVQRYLKGEPIEAKRDSALYVMRKQLRKYRGIAVAAAIILVLSSFFAAAMYLLAQRNRRLAEDERSARRVAVVAQEAEAREKNRAVAAERSMALERDRAQRVGEVLALFARSVNSDHFEVYASGPSEYTLEAVAHFEQLFQATQAFRAELGLLPMSIERKLEVFLFNDPDQYEEYSGRLMGRRFGPISMFVEPENRCVFMSPHAVRQTLAKRAMGEPGRNGNGWWREEPAVDFYIRELIRHEMAHMLHVNLGLLPSPESRPAWYSEGLAMLFEVDGDMPTKTVNQDRLRQFRRFYGEDDECVPDLAAVIGSPRWWSANGQAAYPMGWALCHYLLHRRSEAFCNWARSITPDAEAGSVVTQDYFESHFGKLDDKWRRDFVDYMRSIPAQDAPSGPP